MPKRKTVIQAKTPEAPAKARLELRLENDVSDRVKSLADRAQISVNQLMQALARWVAQYGHAGEPYRDVEGILRMKNQPGCIWMGRPGWKKDEFTAEDIEEMGPHYDECDDVFKGELELLLDFTERRVIREEFEKDQG